MSSAAPDNVLITRRAADPRADGACRVVTLSATIVHIERTVEGVRMRLGVPVASYRDLVIGVRVPAGRATLRLRHDDGELDVVIGSGDAVAVATSARAWSAVTGKPVVVEEACVSTRDAHARRRKGATRSRGSTFARRRMRGVAGHPAARFAGEREIIARN